MKLSRSLLCLDCDEVHEDQRACPSCGSTAPSLVLARVLSPRDPKVEPVLLPMKEVIRATA